MKKPRKTEEQYKEDIFNTYAKLRQESYRRDVLYGQFCMYLFNWCEDYYFSEKVFWTDYPVKKANLYGKEISGVIKRFTKDDNNVPNNNNEFFLYLFESLNNAEREFYRNNKDEVSCISKAQKKKLDEINETILMIESNLGRKLTENEKVEKVSYWFEISKEKVKKYLQLGEIKNVVSLQAEDNNGYALESKIKSASSSDVSDIFNKEKMQILYKAIKAFLEKRQDRSRPCYKAIITLFCLKTIKNIEDLYPILDREILDKVKKGMKIQNYYDIYLNFNPKPEPNIKSAQVSASDMVKEFKKFIKKNYPEFFLNP